MLLWKLEYLDYKQKSLSWRREKLHGSGRLFIQKIRLERKDSSGQVIPSQLMDLASEIRSGLERRPAW